jgi:hypothetical protein
MIAPLPGRLKQTFAPLPGRLKQAFALLSGGGFLLAVGAIGAVGADAVRADAALPVPTNVPVSFAPIWSVGADVDFAMGVPAPDLGSSRWAVTTRPGGAADRLSQQLGDDLSAPSGAPNYNRSAILTSLLLPGLAQYRMGEKERGLAFLTLEAALWTSFTAFRIQGANREDSYVEMAELFAGISPNAPKDEDFYKALSNWPSSELYNEIVVRRLARNEAGDDIEGREVYYEENRIQGDEIWNWSSEVARTEYRTKRTEAQRSFKRSRNMIGLAVANRVVAMIDAVLLSNRLRGSEYGLEVTQSRHGSDLVARVGLRRRLP